MENAKVMEIVKKENVVMMKCAENVELEVLNVSAWLLADQDNAACILILKRLQDLFHKIPTYSETRQCVWLVIHPETVWKIQIVRKDCTVHAEKNVNQQDQDHVQQEKTAIKSV